MVKCRGQNQIKQRISLRDAMLDEERFFDSEEKLHFRSVEQCLFDFNLFFIRKYSDIKWSVSIFFISVYYS